MKKDKLTIEELLDKCEFVRERCNAIALDIYDLSIANGWIDAGEQRALAECIGSKLKEITDRLPPLD